MCRRWCRGSRWRSARPFAIEVQGQTALLRELCDRARACRVGSSHLAHGVCREVGMSKPDTGSAAQSLEEILASIRKSLDDESTRGLSKISKPSVALAADARAPAEPAADGLSSRLAGA